MSTKSKQIAPRAPLNVARHQQQQIEYDRITHCPETGIDLDTVDIEKHVKTLWPRLDEREPMYAEARRRRDHLMHEYDARSTERGMHRVED